MDGRAGDDDGEVVFQMRHPGAKPAPGDLQVIRDSAFAPEGLLLASRPL